MNDRLFPKPEIPCECGHVATLCVVRGGCYYLAYVCDKCGRRGNSARQSSGFPSLDTVRQALDGPDFDQFIKYDKVSEPAFRTSWEEIKQRIDMNQPWKCLPSIGDFV